MKNKALPLIIILVIIIQTFLLSLNGTLAWDEVVYLSNAKSYISNSYFTEDFRFPLLSILIAGIWLITGESIIAAQTFMLLITITTIITFYFIALHYTKKKYLATAAAIALGLSSQFIFWATKIYTDILSLNLIIISFLILLKKQEQKYIILAGLFAGLAFVARLSTIVTATIIVIFLLLNKNWFKNILGYGIGFLVALLPFMIQGLFNQKNPIYFITSQSSVILGYTTFQSPLILINQIISEFGYALVILFGLIILHKKITKQTTLIITILLANLAFYLFYVNLKLARYIIAFAPFLILLIIISIQHLSENINQKKLVAYFFITIMLLSIIISSTTTFNETKNQAICTSQGALKESINYIKNNTEPGQTIISSVWVYYGYYANLKVYSPWTQNIDNLLDIHDPKYFVLSENAGVPLQNESIKKRQDITQEIYFLDSCGYDIMVYKVNK